MKVRELLKKSDFNVTTGEAGKDKDVNGVYVGDLLSRVMGGAKQGSIWITIHTHMNILAVASLNELPLIIIPEGINVPEALIEKAVEEEISIASTDKTAYEVCCFLSEILENK